MKIYSKLCEYAIRALLVLAREKHRRLLVKSICKQENLPLQFTRKALHTLLRHGYVTARRGPTGGYVLKRDPEKISLWELVRLFDVFSSGECLLGRAHCGIKKPCDLHTLKIKSEAQWMKAFKAQSISSLLKLSKKPATHSR